MSATDACEGYRFGRFVLEPARRSLSADTVLVPLGARAFDILLLLVRHHDRVVSKDEILSVVWRGTIVEENNLAVHISALRRALGERPGGDRFIATVSGLGYRFVGSVVDAAERALEAGSAGMDALPTLSTPSGPPTMPAPDMSRPWLVSLIPPRKAVRRVIAVALGAQLALLGALTWAGLSGRSTAFEAPRMSIAVLPFRSLDGGRDNYLADAVTDDLTTDLSHIPGSIVIARESVETFRGRAVGATSIGRTLHVRYLLEGSLLGEGNSFHVNAQLIDATAGTQLWANMFDVERPDLAGSLTEIVERVSSGLRVTLVQAEETRSLREPTRNPDALDFTLQAKSILDRSNSFAGLVRAQGLLEKAVGAAPDDSDALAELGLVLVHKVGDFDDADESVDYHRAIAVIDKASSEAPQNPLAITAQGMLAWVDYRCGDAQLRFHAALLLDSNDLQARDGLALCARELGNMQEMIGQLRDTLRVDPVGSGTAQAENSIGMGYLMLGRPAEAADWLGRAGSGLDMHDGQTKSGDAQAGYGWGWQDWRSIFLIATSELSGDHAGAARRFREFDHRRPHGTVFQLAHYVSRSISNLSGNKAYLDALRAAGMPLYPREDEDFGVPSTGQAQSGGDFDPTPLTIPGGQRADTRTMQALMSAARKPLVVDLGSNGSTVMPEAVRVSPDDMTAGLDRELHDIDDGDVPADRPIVTMSYGPFGWDSYDAALYFIDHGFRHVFWYRGGEAAWVAAGHPTQDRRAY